MARGIKDSVVVITGASSGIGRAAAHAFAREGAVLVLAARRVEGLNDAAVECETRGGRTLVVPTDVTDEGAVERLAFRAVEAFGRIDTWVNNAAVTLFARFEEAPSEAFRRILEVNLFGYVHGARAVLPYFREQGRGVLVQVSSVVATTPQPYTSAYVTSKWAIDGLSRSLRMESALEGGRIRICHVKPASIDTPLFQQAANYTRRPIKPLDPVLPPERVAHAIVSTARRPRREVTVGSAGRLFSLQSRLAPGTFERVAARHVDRDHFQEGVAEPTDGNLFTPMPQHALVRGGWSPVRGGWTLVRGGSTRSRSGRGKLSAALAGAGALAAAPFLVRAWRRA